MRPIYRQTSKAVKGVALITAMMVMSLATITAVSMTAEQQVYFRRTENILLHEQAYLYLLSAEDFAKLILREDFNDNQVDSYQDIWAQQEAVFPIEGGVLTGKISDLQGKFNVNNLAKEKLNKWDEERLRKWLVINNLSADLANAIIDWLDVDEQARFPDGAEDVDYLQGDRPHRAGNGMMGSISELLYIKGIDYEQYQVLSKALVALPATDVAININTASPQVLQMIIDPLSDSEAEELQKELAETPLDDIADVVDHPMIRGKKVDLNGIGIESRYFLLDSFAKVSRASSRMQSVIHRFSADDIKVVLRSQGGL